MYTNTTSSVYCLSEVLRLPVSVSSTFFGFLLTLKNIPRVNQINVSVYDVLQFDRRFIQNVFPSRVQCSQDGHRTHHDTDHDKVLAEDE